MSYHILHYRLKKLKRAFLIWITLISLLIKLWIDSIKFTIFQMVETREWFPGSYIKLFSPPCQARQNVYSGGVGRGRGG